MKRYLKIYLKLLQLSWATLIMYRSNFINSIASSLTWSFFNLIAIILLTAKTSTVFGWTRDELMLLVGVSNIMLGIFYFLFSINLHEFANIINLGKLDSVLLKPIDSQFSLSFWQASYQSISRMIFGICVTFYLLSNMHIHISPMTILFFICLLIFGTILQYSIWFTVITITIKFSTLSNLSDLLYNTNDFTRFPPQMFRQGKELLYFFLFPFTLVTVVPVKSLLQKITFSDIFWLIAIALLFLFVSRKFFHFVLRCYTSASG